MPRLTADDRAEIGELMARYAWALDTDSPQAVGELFSADGVFDGVSGLYEGRARVVEMAARSRAHDAPHLLQHWVANSVFDGDGLRCTVRSMCFGPSLLAGQPTVAFVGTYLDVCVKDAGRWRFARRRWRPWDGRAI